MNWVVQLMTQCEERAYISTHKIKGDPFYSIYSFCPLEDASQSQIFAALALWKKTCGNLIAEKLAKITCSIPVYIITTNELRQTYILYSGHFLSIMNTLF